MPGRSPSGSLLCLSVDRGLVAVVIDGGKTALPNPFREADVCGMRVLGGGRLGSIVQFHMEREK